VESSGSSSNSSNDVSFWYEPAGSQYASTNTDANGKYSLQTTAGRLVLSANADQYVENRTKFSASNGEKKTVNLVLERLPPDSVQVSGTVVDAESGKPIPYAQLSLENQRWGHYNSTMTKEDGQFSFNTKPGYTLLSISAEQQYWMPCTYEASDDPAATSGFAPGEPYPCADGGQRSRDRGYFSVVLSLADGAKTQGLAIKLQPRPAANAELKGYVVNASDQKALPGVQVHFFNEYTRDWGTATTDEFGSFKIKVHAGYYTVRAYAEHYFDGVANVQVQEDESKRVDVPLTPGEKRYGGCCYAMGHSDMGYASKSSSAGGPEPMSVQTVAPQTGSEGSGRDESGSASYQPLTEPKSGGTSPGASVGLLVAALLALALVRRRSV
jgi:hypothetical protein